jgi:hypothetical protein
MSRTATVLKRTTSHAKPAQTPSGDDRSALRLAIENVTAARQRLARHEAATSAAFDHVEATEQKFATLEDAVEHAQQTYTSKIAAALSAGREPPASSAVAEARRAVDACGDELVAAKAAYEQLRAETPDIAAEVAIADNRAVAASNAVLAGPLREWLTRAQRARAETLLCQEILHALTDDHELDRGLPDPALDSVQRVKAMAERVAAISDVRDAARRFLMNIAGDISPADQTKANEVATSWRQVRAALRSDADAPLPGAPQ